MQMFGFWKYQLSTSLLTSADSASAPISAAFPLITDGCHAWSNSEGRDVRADLEPYRNDVRTLGCLSPECSSAYSHWVEDNWFFVDVRSLAGDQHTGAVLDSPAILEPLATLLDTVARERTQS